MASFEALSGAEAAEHFLELTPAKEVMLALGASSEVEGCTALMYGGSQRNSKSFLTNIPMTQRNESGELIGGAVAEELDRLKASIPKDILPGPAYVVRVYRYKARKHQVRFLGIGVRSKRADLTNIENAQLFEYDIAAKIIAATPSMDGVQYHILTHTEAIEKERERSNKK